MRGPDGEVRPNPGIRARRWLTTVQVEQGGRITLTTTVRYESREARHSVLKYNMSRGVEASYERLADLVASPAAHL